MLFSRMDYLHDNNRARRIPQHFFYFGLPEIVVGKNTKNSNFFEELALDQNCALLQGGVGTLMDCIFTSPKKIKEEFKGPAFPLKIFFLQNLQMQIMALPKDFRVK